MKQLFIVMLALISAIFFSCNTKKAQAQTGIQLYKTTSVNGTIDSTVTTKAFDTLTNTTVAYMVTRPSAFNSIDRAAYTLSFYARSLTGTPAAVKAVWEGSFNGYDWFKMTGVFGTDGLNCDTLSFTPSTTATQYKMVSRPGAAKYIAAYDTLPRYNQGCRVFYQRIRWIPSGTQTLRVYSTSIFTSY